MKKIFPLLLLFSISVSFTMPAFANLVSTTASSTAEPGPEAIKSSLAEFKNLSKKERKERISQAKKEIRKFNREKKESKKSKVDEVILILLAILLPPLAVYLHQGEVNGKFWISLLLWFIFIIPGIIYALLVVTDNA